MYQRILIAYDGSESGQKALLDCRDIAQWSNAQLFLVAVCPLPAAAIGMEGGFVEHVFDVESEQQYQDILDDGLRRLRESGHTVQGEVLVGERVDQIVSYAKKIDADLIVVGHKHLEGWAARWWRGSSSPALIERSHCSVLVAIT
jgi:nucleotide-binding universal stress UspA family protein